MVVLWVLLVWLLLALPVSVLIGRCIADGLSPGPLQRDVDPLAPLDGVGQLAGGLQ